MCIQTVSLSCALYHRRCDLETVEGTGTFHCCCRDDLCNALDGIVGDVTPPTQGTIAMPSGTPPIPTNGNIVCEAFSEEEHIYKSCSICTATYK